MQDETEHEKEFAEFDPKSNAVAPARLVPETATVTLLPAATDWGVTWLTNGATGRMARLSCAALSLAT